MRYREPDRESLSPFSTEQHYKRKIKEAFRMSGLDSIRLENQTGNTQTVVRTGVLHIWPAEHLSEISINGLKTRHDCGFERTQGEQQNLCPL